MRGIWRFLFPRSISTEDRIRRINLRRTELAGISDEALRDAGRRSRDLLETIAVTAVIAARVQGLVMFDVQLQGALAMADGKIAEMQTGEGKTLAAVSVLFALISLSCGDQSEHDPIRPFPFYASLATRAPPLL